MSLSTTSTATYTLSKYSRAYPSSTNRSEADVEWQHFTNPVMQLVLDIKKKTSGEPESYRVRVLWRLNQGLPPDSMDVDQREIAFEDVDLLSFSPSTSQYSDIQTFSTHGLPLKAVYRDAVVGIRYMHPRVISNDTTPSYRRFQVNFQKTSDAKSFVDAIRHVCPCKANGPPTGSGQGLSARSLTMNPSSVINGAAMRPPEVPSAIPAKRLHSSLTMPPEPQTKPVAPPHRLTSSSTALLDSQTRLSSTTAANSSVPLPVSHSQQDRPEFPNDTVDRHVLTSLQQPLERLDVLCPTEGYQPRVPISALLADQPPTPYPQLPENLTSISRNSGAATESASQLVGDHVSQQSVFRANTSAASGSSVLQSAVASVPIAPSSTLSAMNSLGFDLSHGADSNHHLQITSSQQTPTIATPAAMPAPLPTSVAVNSASAAATPTAPSSTTKDILSALQNSRNSPLYNLPLAELEMVVASVLREDGFLDMMKTLDGMWRVKGFVKSMV